MKLYKEYRLTTLKSGWDKNKRWDNTMLCNNPWNVSADTRIRWDSTRQRMQSFKCLLNELYWYCSNIARFY